MNVFFGSFIDWIRLYQKLKTDSHQRLGDPPKCRTRFFKNMKGNKTSLETLNGGDIEITKKFTQKGRYETNRSLII